MTAKREAGGIFLGIMYGQLLGLLATASIYTGALLWTHGEGAEDLAAAWGGQCVPWLLTVWYGLWRYDE